MGCQVKVITIQQPYASLIALRLKSIETRPWKPDYLGPVLIHAGKGCDFASEFYHDPIRSLFAKQGIVRFDQLPLGMAVALSRIVSYSRTECLRDHISPQERLLGNYLPKRWGWQLGSIRRLDTAFALRGAQGLFDWEPPPGFEWKFRDNDPDAPPETSEQRQARHQETLQLLREMGARPMGLHGEIVNGRKHRD